MVKMSPQNLIALAFMTFALYVGAGNIIFPPMIGHEAGSNVWSAAFGFLLTGVGLPVLAIIAVALAGGGLSDLASIIGRKAGVLMTIICYLAIGPGFATPRTATVSYELGIAPFFPGHPWALMIYSALFFGGVALVSLYPGRLIDVVGKILSPIKILALLILCVGICFIHFDVPHLPVGGYINAAFSHGVVNGYLTMDTLGSLVFGLVVVEAIKSKGVKLERDVTRYAIFAGIMAGMGLTIIYICLFYLGASSRNLSPHAANGAEVLSAYIQHAFGSWGSLFLSVLITLACLVTAIGLTCACARYFSSLTRIGYAKLVWFFALISFIVSIMGLTELIKVSAPVLTAIYPPFIVIILISLMRGIWQPRMGITQTAVGISLLFGIFDGMKEAGAEQYIPSLVSQVPMYGQGLGWIVPTVAFMCLARLWTLYFDANRRAVRVG